MQKKVSYSELFLHYKANLNLPVFEQRLLWSQPLYIYICQKVFKKGGARGWQKYLWGRTVRAKALTPFLHNGAYMCAMPCRIKPETRLNAAHKIGIPSEQTNENCNAMSSDKGSTLESQGINFKADG